MTLQHSTRQHLLPLTSSAEDSRASLFPLPGSERARAMTVSSGLRCSKLSRLSGPLGCLEKMCLASSRWASTVCFLTWKDSATPSGRLLFQLVPWTPRTGETDCGLLPTPTASDFRGGRKGHAWRGPKNNWRDYCRQVLGEVRPGVARTEEAMGYPERWTDLSVSETPLSPNLLKSSGA